MNLLQKLLRMGADLSTRNTLKSALNILGMKPANIDKLYIELKNDINRERFKGIPPKKKIVFIPQCLRNSRKCRAKLGKTGYVCVNCCNCKAARIKREAERLGYRVYIVPGGSLVLKLIKKFKPRAVLGIGCLEEIVAAVEEINIPLQAIELLSGGCKDTDVDLEAVFSALK